MDGLSARKGNQKDVPSVAQPLTSSARADND